LSTPTLLVIHPPSPSRDLLLDMAGRVGFAVQASDTGAEGLMAFRQRSPDTLVASPDGRLGFRPPAPAWLASAGTGDVLAGLIAAMRARGLPAFEAASAGVWLQGRAAEIAGPEMIADDLAQVIPAAVALCTS